MKSSKYKIKVTVKALQKNNKKINSSLKYLLAYLIEKRYKKLKFNFF